MFIILIIIHFIVVVSCRNGQGVEEELPVSPTPDVEPLPAPPPQTPPPEEPTEAPPPRQDQVSPNITNISAVGVTITLVVVLCRKTRGALRSRPDGERYPRG